jgi:hypothetical protein
MITHDFLLCDWSLSPVSTPSLDAGKSCLNLLVIGGFREGSSIEASKNFVFDFFNYKTFKIKQHIKNYSTLYNIFKNRRVFDK